MRFKILIYVMAAAFFMASAAYFFFWAINNFWSGLTWEAIGLSFVLIIVSLTFVIAAYNNSKRLR